MTSPAARMRRIPPKRLESLLLLVTAFFVRAWLPTTAIFTRDQAGTVVNAEAVLHGDWFVPGPGIGWSAFSLGPLFNQVAAIAMIPRHDFADLIVMQALLHSVAVVGFRHLFGELGGAKTARIAAVALALHPVSLAIGASPISSSLVLPTVLLVYWGISRWVMRASRAGFAVACLGMALAVQAHITTLLLLPAFGLGLRRRAPVGNTGSLGIVAALTVAAPMIVHNVEQLLARPDGIRHAGSLGASIFVAVQRALMLEAQMSSMATTASDTLATPAQVANVAFALVGLIGLVTRTRREPSILQSWLAFGLALPTACVVLIPRGALYYYLDSTVPWRCWLVASGVVTLCDLVSAPRFRRASPIIYGLCALIVALPCASILLGRRRAVEDGFVRVDMSRADLRAPLGPQPSPVGVLTVASQRAIGAAITRTGFKPGRLRVHGPWQWLMTDATWVWVAGATLDRDSPPDVLGPRPSFVVFHRRDALALRPREGYRAGAFLVYPFDDALESDRIGDATSNTRHVSQAHRALPVVVQVVTSADAELDRASSSPSVQRATRAISPAGFAVWTAHLSPVGDDDAIVFGFNDGHVTSPLVRFDPDAYAFVDDSATARVPSVLTP